VFRHGLVTAAVAAGFFLSLVGQALAAQPYPLNFTTVDFNSGTTDGLVNSNGTLTLGSGPLQSFPYTDPFAAVPVLGATVDGSGSYSYGTWTSPVYNLSFPFNELVSSWNAKTSPGTWIQSEVLPQLDNGQWASKWYILGRWAYSDSDFHRTSVGGQGDANGFVSIDTFFAKDHPAIAYRLRLTIYRRTGWSAAQAPVSVTRYSAVASNLTNQKGSFPSATTMNGQTIDLGVPLYSQEIHHGHYPEFDNGGEAWCSPTSTAMVVRYWQNKTGTPYAPSVAETSWVNPPQDPEVDYAARFVYDYHYQGAGNWPFNTAYAASQTMTTPLEGYVVRFTSMAQLETWVKDGVPVVISFAWKKSELDGVLINSSDGHLAVVVGFDAAGNPIVNDPATPLANGGDEGVQRMYNRTQLETIWLQTSGGTAYLMYPTGHAQGDLPAGS
jgi:Peptidase_C39 like family